MTELEQKEFDGEIAGFLEIRKGDGTQLLPVNEDDKDRIQAFISSLIAKREREICICAAVKTGGNVVIRGHRHADCIRTIKEYNGTPLLTPEAQGFVTSRSRFVTREEGRKLQDAAGIPSADETGYRGDTLFSEDLY